MQPVPTPKSNANAHRNLNTTFGLWFMALSLAFASFLGFFGRQWWLLDLTNHFRVQYVGAALVVLPVTCILRRWWPSAIVLASLILNLCLVLPLYVRDGAVPQGELLRIMSANVNAANGRHDQLRDVVLSKRPDVVFILEYNTRWQTALEGIEATYPFSCKVPRDGNFGIAVYSRVPLTDVTVLDLERAGFPSITAKVRIGNRHCTVMGVHVLPPMSRLGSALRNAQFKEIVRWVRNVDGAHVVVGDLNCTSWSPLFRDLLDDSHLRDSRVGFGVQATWPDQRWLMIPIDHCLVSSEFSIHNRSVARLPGSDHWAVIVDLMVRGGLPDSR